MMKLWILVLLGIYGCSSGASDSTTQTAVQISDSEKTEAYLKSLNGKSFPLLTLTAKEYQELLPNLEGDEVDLQMSWLENGTEKGPLDIEVLVIDESTILSDAVKLYLIIDATLYDNSVSSNIRISVLNRKEPVYQHTTEILPIKNFSFEKNKFSQKPGKPASDCDSDPYAPGC